MALSRVLSDYIKVLPNSDFTLSGWLKSEDGKQNAALGVELYDAKKRLRNRVWAIRKSDAVPSQGARFATRLVNSKDNQIFAGNTAYMRILLQSGLISKGSVWFDDFRLRNTASKDPVNLLVAGDFENAGAGNVPAGVIPQDTGVSLDFSRHNTGYASLKLSTQQAGEKGFVFAPLPISDFKPDQELIGSFYFYAEKQIKGMLIVEMLDSSGKPLSRRLAMVDFECDKGKWSATSFSFKIKLKKEEEPLAKSIQLKLISNLPADSSIWLDSFVLR
jgi:hypothetical protein